MPYLSLLNECGSSTPYAINVIAVANPLTARTPAPVGAAPLPGFPGGPAPNAPRIPRPGSGTGGGNGNGGGPFTFRQSCFPTDLSNPNSTYSYFVFDGSKTSRYNNCQDPGCSIVCQLSDVTPSEKQGCDQYSYTTVNDTSTTVTGSKLRVSYYPDSACQSSPLYFYDVPYHSTCTKGAQGNYTLSNKSDSFMTNVECSDSNCQSCTNQDISWPAGEGCTIQSNIWGVYYSKSQLILPPTSSTPIPIPAADSQQSSNTSVNVGLIAGLSVAGFLVIIGAIGLVMYYRRKPQAKPQPEKSALWNNGVYLQPEFVPEMDRDTYLLYLDAQNSNRN